MVAGETGSRSSRPLRREGGGTAKGIYSAPTCERREPVLWPFVNWEKEGKKCETTWQRWLHYGHVRTDQHN